MTDDTNMNIENGRSNGEFVEGLGEFKLSISSAEALSLAKEWGEETVSEMFNAASDVIDPTTFREIVEKAKDVYDDVTYGLTTPEGRAALAVTVLVMTGCLTGGFASGKENTPSPATATVPPIVETSQPTELPTVEATQEPTVEATPAQTMPASLEGVAPYENASELINDENSIDQLPQISVDSADLVNGVPKELLRTYYDYILAHPEEFDDLDVLSAENVSTRSSQGYKLVDIKRSAIKELGSASLRLDGSEDEWIVKAFAVKTIDGIKPVVTLSGARLTANGHKGFGMYGQVEAVWSNQEMQNFPVTLIFYVDPEYLPQLEQVGVTKEVEIYEDWNDSANGDKVEEMESGQLSDDLVGKFWRPF